MEFYRALPEIFILGMACLILMVDTFIKQRRLVLTYTLTQLTLIAVFILSLMQFNTQTYIGFHGTFIRDHFTTLLELVIYLTTFVVFLFSRDYILDRTNLGRGEYYVLGLFSMLGMMVLVAAHSLITIYLGLELLSLPLYAMVAMKRDDGRATEAAMKYFVMGALASGMLLYGMSLIFGATHSIDLAQIAQMITTHHAQMPILMLGLVFLIAGIAFKLGVVPFHMWLPDVYTGAPISVVLFVSTAPKIAAFAMAVRLLVEMLPTLHMQWQPLLILLAILSMGLGNFLAIAQTNIKRMLAYSGIAHIGYMLLGLIAGTQVGYSSALFYMIAYVFMALAAFSMLILLSRKGFECEQISDLQGLNTRSPWLALMMLFIMFSMAGIPPFIGFFAKLSVLEALINVHLVWLAVVAMVFAIVGVFYYLRVVKVMYFEKPEVDDLIDWGLDRRVILSTNAMALLFFGVFPSGLYALCQYAFLGWHF